MDKNIYFFYMKETSEKVFPIILEYVEKIKAINNELYGILKFFIDQRTHKLLLKPFLTRLSYEISGGSDWEKISQICAVFELLNISSYQSNASFDNKLGILSQAEKNSQFIASIVTRELCSNILSEAEDSLEKEKIYSIAEIISNSNKNIYIAQHYDLNVLKIENLAKYINDENLFMEDYLKRCYYGSGIFNGDCAYAGGLLAGANKEQLEALRNFGENYGIGLQIMNDLADFVPADTDDTVSRSFQDQFSDLKNGRLTLGFYKILKTRGINIGWIIDKIRKNERFASEELNEITNILVEARIVDFTKSLSMHYAKKAKKSLSIFPNSEIKQFLSVMTSICYENKYLKCFPKFKENVHNIKMVFS